MRKQARNTFLLVVFASLFFAACNNNKDAGNTDNMPGMNMPHANKSTTGNPIRELDTNNLKGLLRPTTELVVSSLPVVKLQQSTGPSQLNALGSVQYDNRQIHALSSRIAGRIEKLYIRYRYQFVNKGQKVLEIYSPELLTAQENLIFISRSDPGNQPLISAARQRLLLLGMSGAQIAQILQAGKPLYRVAVYSPYAGYITEKGFGQNMNGGNENGTKTDNSTSNMTASASMQGTTTELPVKEGMYVEKAQPIFSLINAVRGRISLSIFASEQNLIKVGTPVMIVPETAPAKKFRATIDWIEPFFQPGSKTLSARVYFNNAALQLPIGSQVQATIFTPPQTAYWLPASAVITTGLRNVVFKKVNGGFTPKAVAIGFRSNDRVQITSGLSLTDSVAINAQHLTESESIIIINEQK